MWYENKPLTAPTSAGEPDFYANGPLTARSEGNSQQKGRAAVA